MRNKGFTLIELLAVILVLGVIALIAIPSVSKVVETSKKSSEETTANNLVGAAKKKCMYSKMNLDKTKEYHNDIRQYAMDGSASLRDVLEVEGDIPSYSDLRVFEYDNNCNVKLIYQKNSYSCSNLIDSANKPIYEANNATIAERVSCTKNIVLDEAPQVVTNQEYTMRNYFVDNNLLKEDIHSEEYSDKILHIYFTNTNEVPADAVISWDVSAAKDGSIKAWLVFTPESNSYYDLYIGSNGKIMAPKNSVLLLGFYPSVTSISFGNFYTDNVEDMSYMFYHDYAIQVLNVGSFNTSKVTTMVQTFTTGNEASSLSVTSALTEIRGLENWDVSNVTDMYTLFGFNGSLTNYNISNWNTSNVVDMEYMFAYNHALTSLNISNWDTSKVESFVGMFLGADSLTSLDLSGWETPSAVNMTGMFYGLDSLTTLDLSNFNTSNVRSMQQMFSNSSNLTTLNLSGWDTSKVETLKGMFDGCYKLSSLDVSHFNTANVTNMSRVFYNTTALKTLNLSNWNTSKVTDMSYMFAGSINPDLSNPFAHLSTITTITGVEYFDTSNVTDMSYMFAASNGLKILNLSRWNTSNVTNLSHMFEGAKVLSSLKITGWNTSKVTNMEWFVTGEYISAKYYYRTKLGIIAGIENIDVSNVTNFNNTFYRFNGETLDLSKWNTAKATSTDEMFNNTNLITIYVGDNWDMSKVTSSVKMFLKSTKLVGGNGLTYDENNIDVTYANYTDGYLTYKS